MAQPSQPANTAPVQEWVDWFYLQFMPFWVDKARDPAGFGFFDVLSHDAQPVKPERRTLLAQARLLFTLSHLALQTGDIKFKEAAQIARDSLHAFQKEPGLYSRARTHAKQPTDDAEDNLAYSYDQTFVILGLSTWGRLNPDQDVSTELETSWQAFENRLTDNESGLLLEHDEVTNPSHADSPWRSQNPHMHLYEATLQAYEMTNNTVWLDRAKKIRAKGLEYFFDQTTGTLVEFIAPDLKDLPGRDGLRREIGHQCEWAWLLCREAELGGDPSVVDTAKFLLLFADTHGYAQTGEMKGAAFDAVSSDISWREDSFLMWPQTEAIKTYAIRHTQADHKERAQHLMRLVFTHYFADYTAFVNQLDNAGKPIWSEALSRLHYHLVLALSEGARAGLWDTPKTKA